MNPAQRDHGLRRVSATTRWVAVAGIGLAGVLSAYVAKAAPGRNLNRSSVSTGDQSATDPGAGGQTQVQQPDTNPDDGAAPLVPAAVAPVRGRGRSGAVSGGS